MGPIHFINILLSGQYVI